MIRILKFLLFAFLSVLLLALSILFAIYIRYQITVFFLGKDFFDEPTVSTAGYYYADNHIMGFSHARLIGTGAYEGGHFRVFPSTGEKSLKNYLAGDYHRFSHKNKLAFPGYYAVKFKKQVILAELSATERVGVHRYTFSGNETPHILIDVSSSLGKGFPGTFTIRWLKPTAITI